MMKGEDIGPEQLLAICRGARSFYREAAEVSRSHRQIVMLQNLELQRAAQAQELQNCVQSSPGPPNLLAEIPLVRSVRDDDARVLELSEHLDRGTILAYQHEIARTPLGGYRALLERHLEQLLEGRERCDSLRSRPS